jgi:hypothetical protein
MCQFIFSRYIKKKTDYNAKKQVDTSSLAINKDKSSISAKETDTIPKELLLKKAFLDGSKI